MSVNYQMEVITWLSPVSDNKTYVVRFCSVQREKVIIDPISYLYKRNFSASKIEFQVESARNY